MPHRRGLDSKGDTGMRQTYCLLLVLLESYHTSVVPTKRSYSSSPLICPRSTVRSPRLDNICGPALAGRKKRVHR